MKTIKSLISTYAEIFTESIHRHIYLRKLAFAIDTARKFNRFTKRKYYIVNDIAGSPIFVTAVQLETFKAKGLIPKSWTHVDMEKNAIHVIPDGR